MDGTESNFEKVYEDIQKHLPNVSYNLNLV